MDRYSAYTDAVLQWLWTMPQFKLIFFALLNVILSSLTLLVNQIIIIRQKLLLLDQGSDLTGARSILNLSNESFDFQICSGSLKDSFVLVI